MDVRVEEKALKVSQDFSPYINREQSSRGESARLEVGIFPQAGRVCTGNEQRIWAMEGDLGVVLSLKWKVSSIT